MTGPTASGKTTWSLDFAKKHHCAIISADSRTVYRELSLGAGKVTTEYPARYRVTNLGPVYDIEGIPHYGLDLVGLDEVYTASRFKDYVSTVSRQIEEDGWQPMLVGGSGLYIDAVRHGYSFPSSYQLPPEWFDRPLDDLLLELDQRDPETAEHIDRNNRRRVVRALAYVLVTNQSFKRAQQQTTSLPTIAAIVNRPRAELYERIDARVDLRMEQGMLEEVRGLVEKGLAERLLGLGLEYRILTEYLLGHHSSLAVAVERLKFAIHAYARRQLTWWRRQSDVHWVSTYTELEDVLQ